MAGRGEQAAQHGFPGGDKGTDRKCDQDKPKCLLPGNVRPVALQERRPLEPFNKPLYSWPMKLRPRNDVLFQRPP
jgi:hypothetical protein